MKKRLLTCLAGILLLGLLLSGAALADASGFPPGLWLPDLSGEVPVVSITTADGSFAFLTDPVRESKLQGLIDYTDAAITVTEGRETLLADAPAQVKARGNWTLEYPKKSVRIKFANKQPMAGLNGGKAFRNWVLLADWKDLSMLHNPTALFLAHNLLGADGYYCADYRFAELYVNGEYWGLYLLTEQQEVKSGRVELPQPSKDDDTRETGYFFEYDAYFGEEALLPGGDATFEVYHAGMTQEQHGYTIKSDINASRQKNYLRSWVRLTYRIGYEAAVNGRHFAFNEKGTEIAEFDGVSVTDTVSRVIDLPSLVDTYILQELTCNPDAGWSSFYMTADLSPDGSKRLTFQAPWDFDSCFGIRSGYESWQGPYLTNQGNPWLNLFAGEDWFRAMVESRWAQLRRDGIPDAALTLVTRMTDLYAGHFARNYDRWPDRITGGNHELIAEVNAMGSQPEAAAYLHRWLTARIQELDRLWHYGGE